MLQRPEQSETIKILSAALPQTSVQPNCGRYHRHQLVIHFNTSRFAQSRFRNLRSG